MKYKTEKEIADIVRGFETGTLPRDEFSHSSHLIVAMHYVRLMPVEDAIDKMRGGLMNHLRHVGVDFSKEMPYHETLTVFWTRTVNDFVKSKNGASLLDTANELVEAFDKDYPLKFYRREILFSDEARRNFIMPDRYNSEDFLEAQQYWRVPFVVNETPYCFWDVEIKQKNKQFIDQIDPDYFDYVAHVNMNILQSNKDKPEGKKVSQLASAALRIAYSQGLEVLFGTLGATVQAPDCVFGWLLKYSNKELELLTGNIQSAGNSFNKLKLTSVTWKSIAEKVLSGIKNEESFSLIVENFSTLWADFAQTFLDEKFKNEYNGLKHGMRVKIGGYHLAMGLEETFGEFCPPEKMETITKSDFGSTFLLPVKIQNSKTNFTVDTISRNWSPEELAWGLKMISVSIRNIVVFLKMFNNISLENEKYIIPARSEFISPHRLNSQNFGVKSQVPTDHVNIMEKQEIKSNYESSN